MFKNTPSFSSFSVNDLTAARKFYHETLGISTSESLEGLELHLEDHPPVFVYQKADHVPATYTILNFVVPDITAAVADLTAAGVPLEHYDEEMLKTDEHGIAWNNGGYPGPTGIAWFRDPAGNFLSVLQK